MSEEAPVADWVNGVNAAGWEFYRSLEGDATTSPLSAGLAFSLLRAGTSGETAEKMDNIFGFPEGGTHDAANSLVLSMFPDITGDLSIAQRLFFDRRLTIEPDFLETAKRFYGANVEPVDSDAWLERPNDDVLFYNTHITTQAESLNTEDSVAYMDSDGDQESSGRYILLDNTIYFNYDWERKFDLETGLRPFNLSEQETVDVQYMLANKRSGFSFTSFEGFDVVGIEYVNRPHGYQETCDEYGGCSAPDVLYPQPPTFTMWLVLPHEIDGLSDVESSLSASEISSFPLTALTVRPFGSGQEPVSLLLPKWYTSTKEEVTPHPIQPWLSDQGIRKYEEPFGQIYENNKYLFAIRDAGIVVDEEGSEMSIAAPRTGVTGRTGDPYDPDLENLIRVDRPFLWAVVHQDTGAILFLGRVLDPSPAAWPRKIVPRSE